VEGFGIKKEYLISMFSMSDQIFRLRRSKKIVWRGLPKKILVVFISSVEEE